MSCNQKLEEFQIKNFLDAFSFNKYISKKLDNTKFEIKNKILCKNSNCCGFIISDKFSLFNRFKCQVCLRLNCLMCNNIEKCNCENNKLSNLSCDDSIQVTFFKLKFVFLC